MIALVHDQGAIAWFIVAAYLVGALLAFRAASNAAGRERGLWGSTAVALVLLGLNKQLDLQSGLTLVAKIAASKEGWYEWRRGLQGAFLLLMAIAATAFAAFLWRWLRGASMSAKVAAIGLVMLLAFILMRAASFHHLDYWVTFHVGGMRSGWWLELLGIAVISVSAAAFCGGRSRSATRPN